MIWCEKLIEIIKSAMLAADDKLRKRVLLLLLAIFLADKTSKHNTGAAAANVFPEYKKKPPAV